MEKLFNPLKTLAVLFVLAVVAAIVLLASLAMGAEGANQFQPGDYAVTNTELCCVPCSDLDAEGNPLSDGLAENILNLVLLLGGMIVPGAGWLASFAKAKRLAKVADGLTQVISDSDSPDEAFLKLADKGHFKEAAQAIGEMIKSKQGV